ncbi:MAG: hypothetical protein M0R22_00255 [Dehalococcoidia bacterium]|jgi:hypothetical protein|nr:hypothetical protein [Dehalococcoidia bacterium]
MSNLLSIYCFYKNELESFGVTVPTWLPFLEGGGELVLVDTGSSDRSREWAGALAASPQVAAAGISVKSMGAPWPDPMNWAAITQQTMDLCSRPWRLRLDADEKLEGDPKALASVLRNLEQLAVDQGHSARDGLLMPGTCPVALSGLCVFLHEPETGVEQYRSRLHRAGWTWKYRIDPVPVPPPGEEGGVFMLLQNWICRVIHTRASIRPDALARAEGVLELAEQLDGPLDGPAQVHYQNAIDRARIYGKKEGEI